MARCARRLGGLEVSGSVRVASRVRLQAISLHSRSVCTSARERQRDGCGQELKAWSEQHLRQACANGRQRTVCLAYLGGHDHFGNARADLAIDAATRKVR